MVSMAVWVFLIWRVFEVASAVPVMFLGDLLTNHLSITAMTN